MNAQIFDVHSHPLIPSFVESLGAELGDMALPPWSVAQHLDMMDKHGVAVALLSVNSVAEVVVGRDGRALARKINEELAALVAAHPTRFAAVGIVPMDDMDAALEETTHALDVLKLDGLSASTHRTGKYLGEPDYDPWFDEMNRRATPLFVHPSAPPGFDPAASKTNVSVLEFMFDTTRMVTTLVLSGAKRRFDKIPIIATHGGGTIPFLATRIGLAGSMSWAYRGGPTLAFADIVQGLSSFYFDLTAATSATSLDALLRLVSPDRLLMGFDFPLMPVETVAPALEGFMGYPGLADADRRKIAWGNAVQLFPRFA